MSTTTRPTTAEPITPELSARLIADVRKTWPELTDELGARGVQQMAAYLGTVAHSTEPLTPSLRVDLFWHAFILRTAPYTVFCKSIGVDYIHHVPEDNESGTDPEKGRAALTRTTDAIRAAGYDVDAEFWPGEDAADCTETPFVEASDCTQCHAGCHNSPKK
ncbi:hypothetical protein ABZ621_19505 [Streptomyces sp. NPDC007863]|uniref:hypothetical protein n=1 Tax=Streptomyces sp. NPDC007863 TaxID=3154894 RepID=UPI0033CB303B